jgi:hypothetical protein
LVLDHWHHRDNCGGNGGIQLYAVKFDHRRQPAVLEFVNNDRRCTGERTEKYASSCHASAGAREPRIGDAALKLADLIERYQAGFWLR